MTITLDELFHGHESAKMKCIRAFNAGMKAKEIANLHITPILADLEKNAGQKMDPTFIAWMVKYAMSQICKHPISSLN